MAARALGAQGLFRLGQVAHVVEHDGRGPGEAVGGREPARLAEGAHAGGARCVDAVAAVRPGPGPIEDRREPADPPRRCLTLEGAVAPGPRGRTPLRRSRSFSASSSSGHSRGWSRLGTCGEDSDISAGDYERLCAGGRISRNLVIVALAAVLVTVGLGAATIRRRAARPVLMLTALLTLAGAASLAADRL
jgi:hypothetical protein